MAHRGLGVVSTHYEKNFDLFEPYSKFPSLFRRKIKYEKTYKQRRRWTNGNCLAKEKYVRRRASLY